VALGVTRSIAEFLAQAANRGVNFERTLTVGRQTTFVGPHRLRSVLRDHGPAWARERDITYEDSPWTIEPFLAALGAQEIRAMDSSGYEGAEIIHDLNEPVPDEFHERFTLLFDGGSLEHVFNVPVALASYMELVEVGGHVIILTSCNNYSGHGMYQFSPELFFRVLSRENGFSVERMVAIEDYVSLQPLLGGTIPYALDGRWFDVIDPAVFGDRVLLQNSRPVLLAVQARRTDRVTPLVRPVYQSDYAVAWQSSELSKVSDEPVKPPQPSRWGRRAEALARRRLSVAGRMTLALDLLPRALPFLNPFWLGRESRKRSFANRALYRQIRPARGRIRRRIRRGRG
jgi:hypothetical protein